MVLYSIYFTHNGQVVRLPHNPSELPEEKEMDPGDYNVLGLGPVSVPRLPGQRKISISSYFPSNITGGLLGLLTTVPPETYIKFFQDAMDSGDPVLYTPVRIDETGIPYALSLLGYYVIVTSFKFREKGGETGDFYYDLECKEYRDYTPGRVVLASEASGTAGTASAASLVSGLASSRARTRRTALPGLASARAASAVVVSAGSAASSGTSSGALRATVEPSRMTGPHQLVVGSRCTLSGSYWTSAEMGAPETPASGLACTVARICGSDQQSPVYIKGPDETPVGWTKKSMLSIQSGNALAAGR